MNKADEYLLASLRQDVLADLPDDQWQMVTDEVEKAGGVRQVGGYAATIIHKAVVEKKSKIETVMGEFKEGKLRSSSGKKVKSRKQAIAIALSEQRRVKKEVEEIAKASFGGNRSDAGRYAANVRWQKQGKGDAKGGKGGKGVSSAKGGTALDELRASLEEARGMLEVEQDLAAAGNKGAADRAKVTADRIRGLESDIKSMESGAPKAPKKSAGVDERTAGMIRDGDLSDLAGMIVRDLRSQGKKMPFGAQPYVDAMRSLGDISENYGMDSGKSIVAYALSNLAQYKGETAKAIKAELKRRLKESQKRRP